MKKLIHVFCLTGFCLLLFINCFAQATWTKGTDFGGGIRAGATSFVIGNKAYMGLGVTSPTQSYTDLVYAKDFWTWAPCSNVWTQVSDFPGGVRESASCFVTGNKGYVGLGCSGLTNAATPGGTTKYYQDFYE